MTDRLPAPRPASARGARVRPAAPPPPKARGAVSTLPPTAEAFEALSAFLRSRSKATAPKPKAKEA